MMLFINRNCYNFTANTCSLSECFFFKRNGFSHPQLYYRIWPENRGVCVIRGIYCTMTVRDNIFLSYKPLILFKGVHGLKR